MSNQAVPRCREETQQPEAPVPAATPAEAMDVNTALTKVLKVRL